jgi:hypothetical protein
MNTHSSAQRHPVGNLASDVTISRLLRMEEDQRATTVFTRGLLKK